MIEIEIARSSHIQYNIQLKAKDTKIIIDAAKNE